MTGVFICYLTLACEMYNINEDFIVPCTDCGGNENIPYLTPEKDKIIQGYFLQKGLNNFQNSFN